MDFVPFLILLAINKKVMDWFRVIIPDTWEAKVLIPIGWVIGIGLALIFSASPELAGDITIWGDYTLASAGIPLVIVYGIAIGSGAGIIHDAVKPNTPPHDDPTLALGQVKENVQVLRDGDEPLDGPPTIV